LLWPFIIAAAAGLVLGFWFRAPAIIASSAGIVALAVPLGLQAGSSPGMLVLMVAALLLVHQCAYLVGLLLRQAWVARRR
jgi:hypothetical protein